ncbi:MULTISPECIES: dCTP deaminase [unclassified Pseudomonas]|uniref:dCTP deaminase n=1 Tax=unclassified Pseudomonas TaxID=196821 RepID=UPI0008715E53|nr:MULTISPECIES: dCTP deaminase [unclassified Pseudomonas]SCW96196.1 dCTP deaminase [Pseudomonas sp. NFACC56-3]SFL06516.1 dCTP deaminase [Pseudomonas sp. NFACC52]
MILTGNEITRETYNGRIVIEPFDESCVNPNSYNFTLSDTFLVYESGVLDTKADNKTSVIKMVDGEITLEPFRLYLAATRERIGSNYYAPTYAARSSVARLGMFINLSAPLGDIGFIGNWTLQLFAIHPVKVYEGMRIGQMMFWQPQGERLIYDGKYQGASGPMKSQIYRDIPAVLTEAEFN